jgi:hypothetical protein
VLERWFARDSAYTQQHTRDARVTTKGHGRLVTYHIRTTAALNAYLQEEYGWPDVGQVIWIERTCVTTNTGEMTRAVHYAISSVSLADAPPTVILQHWRDHWQIENTDHWVRDVVFGEDRCRARTGTLPLVLSLLRTLVIARLRLAGMENITAARSRLSSRLADIAFLVGVLLA